MTETASAGPAGGWDAPPRAPAAVLIAGPTASGKSALAMRLAARLGGVVINADSMQVYRDLRILTARPSEADEATVPHDLFGTVDGAVNYSVGKWLADAGVVIAAARAGTRLPILVGGTGLYFKALTQGLSDIPAVPPEVRDKVRRGADGMSAEALHARLAARDGSTAAGVRPSDPQRILRALEVFEATGMALAAFQRAHTPALLPTGTYVAVFLAPNREALAATIDRRFVSMVEAGALTEVKGLAARGLDPTLPVMRAHGVPGLLALLRGEIDIADAVARGQRDTRRYVKRQFTFARHQLPDFAWVAPTDAEAAVQRSLGA